MPGFETELVGDQRQLGFLGGVERVGVAPVAAAVDHAAVEHPAVEVVADVVVVLADLERAGAATGGSITLAWATRARVVGEISWRARSALWARRTSSSS